MNGAVILAAGSSSRIGKGVKKEFLTYLGKPLLYHGVKTFIDSHLFSVILIVCRPDLLKETRNILKDFKGIEYTTGGITRRKSVLNSLEYLKERKITRVFIHDGARPFVSEETLNRVINMVNQEGACIPVEPAIDTMKLIDASGIITTHLKREFTMGAQTPQGFLFDELLTAHRKVEKQGLEYTDDSEIWDKYVGAVHTVEGNKENIKITYLSDLEALGIKPEEII